MSSKEFVGSATALVIAIPTLLAASASVVSSNIDRISSQGMARHAFARANLVHQLEASLNRPLDPNLLPGAHVSQIGDFVPGVGSVSVELEARERDADPFFADERPNQTRTYYDVVAHTHVSDGLDEKWVVTDHVTIELSTPTVGPPLQWALPDDPHRGRYRATLHCFGSTEDPLPSCDPTMVLRDVCLRTGNDPPAADDTFERFVDRFAAVHAKLSKQEVKVPVADTEVDIGFAAWVLLGLVIASLVILRARLAVLLSDENGGAEEPFFIADARRPWEMAIASAWVAALVVAPAVAAGGVLSVVAGEKAVEAQSATISVVLFVACAVAMGIGTSMGLVVAGQLAQLRELRAPPRGALVPPSAPSLGPEESGVVEVTVSFADVSERDLTPGG